MAAIQLSAPQKGDTLAVMHTNMGDIKIKLFPKKAPKTVENFVTHSKNGYYNGLKFHRVINDFMIQGGDPRGNGTGGESIWGGSFSDEFDPELHNLRGALSMAIAAREHGLHTIMLPAQNAAEASAPSRIDITARFISRPPAISLRYSKYTTPGENYKNLRAFSVRKERKTPPLPEASATGIYRFASNRRLTKVGTWNAAWWMAAL